MLWEMKSAQVKTLRAALEDLGVDLDEVARKYEIHRWKGSGRGSKAPTRLECEAVEQFQCDGDMRALRLALGVGKGSIGHIVARVVGWKAQQRKLAAALDARARSRTRDPDFDSKHQRGQGA